MLRRAPRVVGIRGVLLVLLALLMPLAVAAPVQASQTSTIIGYDQIGTPIYDTANYRGQICGDSSSSTSIYVRNNLRDLAPRLLLRRGEGWFDVRGYNDSYRGAWWWYGTGNDGHGNTYNGWVFLNHITYRDGACH